MEEPDTSKHYSYTLDIVIHDDWGEHTFAQAKYLVHGFDDVLWTNDKAEALRALADDLDRLEEDAQ